jgi:hypothetical protein
MSLSSREDYRAQYVVVYRNMGGRGPDEQATVVLSEVRDKTPVHVVAIRGVPYAWVYETDNVGNYLKTAGEILAGGEVGQVVHPSGASMSAIDIGFATFNGRHNTADVIFHVRRSLEVGEDLRTVRVKASDIRDNKWHRFEFPSLAVKAGEEFFVSITSPNAAAGNAVTVRYTEADIAPGQISINGERKAGDMAYRMVQ